MGSSGSTIKSNQGESPTPDRSQTQPKTQTSPKKQTAPKKKNDDVKTFVPFTGFPTVDRLAQAQAEYAAAKLPVKRGDGGVPEPSPPPTKKADVFRPEDFKTIDDHARQTPLSEAETFSSLAAYLTTPAQTDIDKIRAFYVWTATQKPSEVARFARSDTPVEDTPVWCLLQIFTQNQRSYYDLIFNKLCKEAGIPCHMVKGKVKGASYKIGNSVSGTKQYSAAFVDGAWRFVDQHWGSSFVTVDADKEWELLVDGGAGKTTTRETGTYQEIDDFWFLTDPEVMICTHLAEDPAWQLLARPVTTGEFETMAYLTQSYFDMNLHSHNKTKCVIFTDTGDVTLEFGLPENAEYTFLYALYKSALDKTRDRMNGAQLKQYVFMDVSKKQRKLRVHIEFPWIGKYKINLNGKVLGRNYSSEVCAYVIHCQKPKFTCKPHPLADRDLWGAGGEAEAIGLEPVNHDGGLIIAEDGQAEMAFKMTLAKYMQFKYTLESDDIDQQALNNYVIHYVIDGEVYFLAKLPEFGKYVFKLFAKDTRRHTDFQHVSNYLITSDMGSADQKEFPKSDTGQVGLMDDSGEVTITPVSHQRPLIACKNKGEVDITMSTDRDAEISAHLIRDDKGNAADFSNHVFIERDGKDFTLNVTFPKVGMYLLTVFARPAGGSDDDETATSFKYVINVKQPKEQCTPFPRPLEWNNEFRLIEPRNANLEPDKEVHFAVIVPGATQVYLDNAKNSALASKGQDRWEGDVIPSSGDAELKVYGVFEEDNKSLLEYQILTLSQTKKVEEEQERRMREAELAQQQEASRRQKEREAAEARRQREEEEAERKARDFEENRTQYEEEEAKWQEEEGDFEVETTPTIERQSTIVMAENPEEAWDTWKEQHADMASTMLLTRLVQATRLRERQLLTKAVRDCKEAGLADHEAVVKADRLLRVLAMRTKLQNAVDERELDALLATIQEVEDLGFEKSLQQEMIDARGLAEHLKRLMQLKLVILNMDKNTMTEIRRYDRPLPVLHQVLTAAFLLLGEDEEATSDWKKCRAFCNPNGRDGLQRKIMTFDTKTVHPEVMARCKELLDEFSVTEVQRISAGAGTFFVWAKGVISEVERQNPNSNEKVVPASIYRQQVILNRLPPSPPRFRRNRRRKPPAPDTSNVITPPESSRSGNLG